MSGPTFPLDSRAAWARLRFEIMRARQRKSADAIAPLTLEARESDSKPLTVNCVVFSKDRAMQLDACLRSIERFAPYGGPIVVINRATTSEFVDGYRSLDLGSNARLVAQSDDFQRDVIDVIDPAIEYTVFHTDDDVFFRRPAAFPLLPDRFAAFSLRLGENTTYCYAHNRAQPVPPVSVHGHFMAWNWTRARDDFSYPMSLDGHILRTHSLLRMLSRARFTNPNQLEAELHLRRYLAPPAMLSFRESCLVSMPINVVSSTHSNRAGQDSRLLPHALNAHFLAGARIAADAMDFSTVRATHQEIPLVFKDMTP